ncbi:MAG: ABC transporter ATP-binding protein [Alphaproteobacteria bacterium]|jgi:ABC-type multidrug transport system fused ATPase/permease subunit|nr:ABC transporter ATP-binding protein [Alphaproteobacteria bacterium]MDP7190504.1 ABC transporter ATP-binding protein [Alphaproteobacteria bacterium]HJO89190.1 ABC transporter ATP-binding protein [Alphaproteobacteria bacterium]|tara:strand:- start:3283 stop:5043 length:1761 start_codon:yes stop_codon:yes gene_type:complete
MALLVLLDVSQVVFEGVSVAMLLPIFELLVGGGDPASLENPSIFWRLLNEGFAYLGLNVSLQTMGIVTFSTIIMRQLFKYASAVFRARLINGYVRNAQIAIIRSVFGANISYFDHGSTGDLVNDLVCESANAVGIIFALMASLNAFFLLVVYGGLLILLSWPLTAMAMGIFVFVALSMRGLILKSRESGEKRLVASKGLTSFLVERLRLVRLLRLSESEPRETEQVRILSTAIACQNTIIQTLRARIPLFFEPIVILALLGFVITSQDMFGIKPAVALIFVGMMVRLVPVIQHLIVTYQGTMATLPSVRKIFSRMESLSAAQEVDTGTVPFTGLERGIRFEDVFFTYASGTVPALEAINLEIPKGVFTALVGPSGAGKSTLIDLLPRLRRASRGQVWFDDHRLEDFTLESLRNGVAFVPQSPDIFNVTVASHIRYGRQEAPDAEVAEAARLAGAAEFIAWLPQGYDTLVGEDAGLLSGGQRQRLDLARALLCKCSILILDEPTSGLDADSVEAFQETLLRIREETDTTIILIAHGFSSVVNADQIIVLEEGSVSTIDVHEELMKTDNWYSKAFRKQHWAVLGSEAG